MALKKGDRVIVTQGYKFVSKGTQGVVVEVKWSSVIVSFNGKKPEPFPESKLQKVG